VAWLEPHCLDVIQELFHDVLHALAWLEAMMKFGHDVSFEQARGQIGKGGDKLLPVFLSAD
jgi:hypothetical protein